MILGITLIVMAAGGCWLLLPKLNQNPLSERACLTLLQFAAWVRAIGVSWDAAILRYRLERNSITTSLKSTTGRLNPKKENL